MATDAAFLPDGRHLVVRGYVNARADCLRRHGRCPRTVAREVSAAPLARRLLRRFVQHARGVAGRPG